MTVQMERRERASKRLPSASPTILAFMRSANLCMNTRVVGSVDAACFSAARIGQFSVVADWSTGAAGECRAGAVISEQVGVSASGIGRVGVSEKSVELLATEGSCICSANVI